MNGVIAGQVWREYTGELRRVIAVAHCDDRSLSVIHRRDCEGDSPVWATSLHRWTDYVEGGPRYTLVGGPAETQ